MKNINNDFFYFVSVCETWRHFVDKWRQIKEGSVVFTLHVCDLVISVEKSSKKNRRLVGKVLSLELFQIE